jgi:hypothetical protein
MAVFHLGITECHDKVVTLRRAAGKQNEPRKKKKKKKKKAGLKLYLIPKHLATAVIQTPKCLKLDNWAFKFSLGCKTSFQKKRKTTKQTNNKDPSL